MIDEVRAFNAEQPFRAGAVCALGAVPAWKRAADFLFVQISFSLDPLLRWRDAARIEVPVYAGVLVLASSRMAKRVGAELGGLEIPDALLDRLETDPSAGIEAACEHVLAVRDSGAFDGVHLVPVSRYREAAARLERELL
jgi:methylenetetrahydrofolate reductase (NADPH)